MSSLPELHERATASHGVSASAASSAAALQALASGQGVSLPPLNGGGSGKSSGNSSSSSNKSNHLLPPGLLNSAGLQFSNALHSLGLTHTSPTSHHRSPPLDHPTFPTAASSASGDPIFPSPSFPRPTDAQLLGGDDQAAHAHAQDATATPPPAPARSRRGRKSQAGEDGGPEPTDEEWNRTRKDNHKEVERRRRETINEGINALARIVPGSDKNKGQILARAAEYIRQLKANEASNIEKWTLEKLLMDNAHADLKRESEGWRIEAARWRDRAWEAGWKEPGTAAAAPATEEGEQLPQTQPQTQSAQDSADAVVGEKRSAEYALQGEEGKGAEKRQKVD